MFDNLFSIYIIRYSAQVVSAAADEEFGILGQNMHAQSKNLEFSGKTRVHSPRIWNSWAKHACTVEEFGILEQNTRAQSKNLEYSDKTWVHSPRIWNSRTKHVWKDFEIARFPFGKRARAVYACFMSIESLTSKAARGLVERIIGAVKDWFTCVTARFFWVLRCPFNGVCVCVLHKYSEYPNRWVLFYQHLWFLTLLTSFCLLMFRKSRNYFWIVEFIFHTLFQ